MIGSLEYTHLPLNEEVTSIAGYFCPTKEVRLPFNDKEVLYVVGQAVIESSCCGIGSWGYILVPGYVNHWKTRTNKAGLPVSEVEPIPDKAERASISRIIEEAESIPRVEFW
ncbi:hypothetical protein ACFLYR_00525 [Chloroflexota bacterium]